MPEREEHNICEETHAKGKKEEEKMNVVKKFIAEFMGTFMLCSIVGFAASRSTGANSIAGYGIGMGLTLLVYMFGGISGAHLNPAVTIGCLVAKKIDVGMVGAYIGCQLVAALAAALCWSNLYSSQMVLGVRPGPADGADHVHAFLPGVTPLQLQTAARAGADSDDWVVSDGQLIWLEMMGTMLLVFTVLSVACSKHSNGHVYFGIAIGSALVASANAIGPFTGCCINPAVSFTVAFSYMDYPHFVHLLWYILGQILGAVLGAVIFMFLNPGDYDKPENPATKLVGEFFGTMMLTFNAGLMTLNGTSGFNSALGVGAVLCALVYSLGHVSGAQLNPAVAVGVLASGRDKLSPADFGGYLAAQFVGGIVGALLAVAPYGLSHDDGKMPGKVFQVKQAEGLGTNFDGTTDTLEFIEIFFVEIFYTSLLVGVVLHLCTVTTGKLDIGRDIFGFCIGMAVTVTVVGGSYAGASLNPAVAVGFDLAMAFGGEELAPGLSFGYSLKISIATLLGGAFAAGVFRAVRPEEYNEKFKQPGEDEVVVKQVGAYERNQAKKRGTAGGDDAAPAAAEEPAKAADAADVEVNVEDGAAAAEEP